MLLEDYILYTVENNNNPEEQPIQNSIRVAKEKTEGQCLFYLTNRFHYLAVRVNSNKAQIISKRGGNKEMR